MLNNANLAVLNWAKSDLDCAVEGLDEKSSSLSELSDDELLSWTWMWDLSGGLSLAWEVEKSP